MPSCIIQKLTFRSSSSSYLFASRCNKQHILCPNKKMSMEMASASSLPPLSTPLHFVNNCSYSVIFVTPFVTHDHQTVQYSQSPTSARWKLNSKPRSFACLKYGRNICTSPTWKTKSATNWLQCWLMDNNNRKNFNAHNISTRLNLRHRQSLSGEDGRSEMWKLFK